MMETVSKKVCGLLLLLLGLVLGGWIAFNLLVEMQPEARGQDPLLAGLFSFALISLGLRLWRGGPRVTRVKSEGPRRLLCLALLLALPAAAPARAAAATRHSRTIGGMVYFTNDSPPRRDYRFRLYTRDMRRVVATRRTPGRADFEFRNLRPGRYVLTVTGPYICNLWYEVDVRRQSQPSMTVLGDADCGSHSLPPGMNR